MDWDRVIPGHPGPGGRIGTKQDVRDLLTFLRDASAEVKTAAQAGKCWDAVEKDVKLPKYESWAGYQQNLPLRPAPLLRALGPRHLSRTLPTPSPRGRPNPAGRARRRWARRQLLLGTAFISRASAFPKLSDPGAPPR